MTTSAEIGIGDRRIGPNQPCFVIAEAGLNHDGDVQQAKDLVTAAKGSGADLVKFQIYHTPELCSRSSDLFPLFASLELKREEWREVSLHAREVGIAFSASVFGPYGLELLKELNCGCVKIASGDLTYEQLLAEAARTGLPLLISTGMSYLEEVNKAVDIVKVNGNPPIALLHCVSNYPTSAEDANLRAMQTMSSKFDVPVGFSDHTMDTLVPLAAVASGACIIEKHFTLDRGLPGPDHKLSMTPMEFELMVRNIRLVEKALGTGEKVPVEKEGPMRLTARRSIVTEHELKAGTAIASEDVRIARPGTGIPPGKLKAVLGRKVRRDIPADAPLTWDDL